MPRDRYDDRDDDDDRPRRRDDDYDRPRRRDYDPPKSNTGKVLLIVFGIIGVVVVGAGIGVFFLIMKVRESAARMQTSNNIHQLTIGVHNYNDTYIKLPGPYVGPTDGGMTESASPSDRLSWRYSLLPYIEQDNVYRMMNASQAWNSPANSAGANTVIKTYTDPLDPPAATTRFRCFYNNGALFDTDPTKRVSVSNIPDGSSYTIMFAESSELVPWAQFNEFAFDPNGNPPALGHPSRDVIMMGMADGSVRTVKKTVSPNTLRAAVTRNGNDVIGPDW